MRTFEIEDTCGDFLKVFKPAYIAGIDRVLWLEFCGRIDHEGPRIELDADSAKELRDILTQFIEGV